MSTRWVWSRSAAWLRWRIKVIGNGRFIDCEQYERHDAGHQIPHVQSVPGATQWGCASPSRSPGVVTIERWRNVELAARDDVAVAVPGRVALVAITVAVPATR